MGKIGEIILLLVPMDCGDFDDYFSFLTVQNNVIIADLHVEGLWFQPEGEEGDEEHTSFKLTAEGELKVTSESYHNHKLADTLIENYQILSDGSIKKL